jgi:hypothetical protein
MAASGRTSPFRGKGEKVCNRRVAVVHWHQGEGPLASHKRHSAETLLDHLVGHVEDARRDSEAERLGGVDGVNVSFGEPLDVEEG